MRSIEICAGAGGQALGLEQAGFHHIALIEVDTHACATLRTNRPHSNVIEGDVKFFSASRFEDIDLLAGGVPCPPFSIAGKQLGDEDDRDLFPEALRLVRECSPKAVMLENVRGISDPKFSAYRESIIESLLELGYISEWELIHSHHYGVPQLRPRAILVAMQKEYAPYFRWPLGVVAPPPTVGQLLYDEMASNGWLGAKTWAKQANGIAPTLVGGSKKHGGADLGPTRARLAWEKLGVNGKGLADAPPERDFVGMPKLTVKMAALVQGFPPDWEFIGKKTPAYRQVGNAFPPPVAKAIGGAIVRALLTQGKPKEHHHQLSFAELEAVQSERTWSAV
jgi:DNA (cytosine-5)-methyltransferase 1